MSRKWQIGLLDLDEHYQNISRKDSFKDQNRRGCIRDHVPFLQMWCSACDHFPNYFEDSKEKDMKNLLSEITTFEDGEYFSF